MNKTLLLAGAAVVAFAANANAAEFTPYVSGKLTYSDMSFDGKDTWDKGSHKDSLSDKVWGTSIAAGVSTNVSVGAIRTELEYNWNDTAKKAMTIGKNGPLGKVKVNTQSVFLNAYYDINTNTKFTPYVGGGIGYAKVRGKVVAEDAAINKNGTNFAWQLGAGVAYAVNDKVSVDLGYRYTDMGDISKAYEAGSNYKIDVDSHELLLGARYAF